jgi:hypothetical protein
MNSSLAIAEPEYMDDLVSGRFSILTSGIDNGRIGDGFSVLENIQTRFIIEEELDERTKLEFHVTNGNTLTSDNSAFFVLSPDSLQYRMLDMTWNAVHENTLSSYFSIDRANMKFRLHNADITIGRQAISFGSAWFWNPLDVFYPFDAQAIDRDYKSGADAIKLDIPIGTLSGVNFVTVFGSKLRPKLNRGFESEGLDFDRYGSAVLLRYFNTWDGWDIAMQGGKIYGGYQIGGGIVGEIHKVQIRAEAASFFAENSDPMPLPFTGKIYEDNYQFVVGFGRMYNNSLDIEMEYLFNGATDTADLDASSVRMQYQANRHLSKQLLGANIGYQFSPLVHGQLVSIMSLSDSSFQIEPFITYSVGNNSDFILGCVLNFGDTPVELAPGVSSLRSEFGSYPSTIFAEYKHYF